MRERVEAVLDKVRPMLQGDGGDVELVDITDKGVVQVRLTGACKGCPMSQMTLKERHRTNRSQRNPRSQICRSRIRRRSASGGQRKGEGIPFEKGFPSLFLWTPSLILSQAFLYAHARVREELGRECGFAGGVTGYGC